MPQACRAGLGAVSARGQQERVARRLLRATLDARAPRQLLRPQYSSRVRPTLFDHDGHECEGLQLDHLAFGVIAEGEHHHRTDICSRVAHPQRLRDR
eukprot:scaffold56545_cov63-Phaeocystis_antarctica.AAC.5